MGCRGTVRVNRESGSEASKLRNRKRNAYAAEWSTLGRAGRAGRAKHSRWGRGRRKTLARDGRLQCGNEDWQDWELGGQAGPRIWNLAVDVSPYLGVTTGS